MLASTVSPSCKVELLPATDQISDLRVPRLLYEDHGSRPITSCTVRSQVQRVNRAGKAQRYCVSMKVRDAIKLLERDGWFFKNQTGSHRHFIHPVKTGKVTIAGHSSDEVPEGTLKSIFKQAGIKN